MTPQTRRASIAAGELETAFIAFRERMDAKLTKWGWRTLTSRHEILGVIEEEMDELVKAVREDGASCDGIKEELLDIAVGAIFGYACIEAGKTDW